MLFRKENELDFSCQACGHCCRYFTINITHIDFERILLNRPDLTPEDFVSFTPADSEDQEESFISTYGKKDLSLKKKKNSKECVFLDKNNMCTIHEFKPLVCRVWPFAIEDNKLTWIKEHKQFIKKVCQHTVVKGANDPDEITAQLKQHYKDRKMYAKIVEKWNQDKTNLLNNNEFFSDILDEHFLSFLLKELNIKKTDAIPEKLTFKFLNILKSDKNITFILESNIKNNLISNNNKTFNIYLKDDLVPLFMKDKRLSKITEKLSDYIFNIASDNQVIFVSIDNIFSIYVYPESYLVHKLPFDSKIFYNPLKMQINIYSFEQQREIELKKIYKSFMARILTIISNIKNNNSWEVKLLIIELIQNDLYQLIFWLNKKHFQISDISSLELKTDDLILTFENYYKNISLNYDLELIKDFIDLFERNFKLSGLNIDLEIKNKLCL